MTETVRDRPGSDGVAHERVTFDSAGLQLVGDLYRPLAATRDERLPGLVVTGSWTTVKEQMAGLYARRLAERGFSTLAFDFRHYGESGGEPRDVESPAEKADDIGSAVSYLEGREDVDSGRLAAVAVCASSGYTAVNAARDDRVRSLVMVAPWLHDADLVPDLYGGEDGVRQRVEAGHAARSRFETTGATEYVPAISTTDQRAAMFGDFDYYLSPDRGAIPQWGNRFAVMAWPDWLEFDPIKIAPEIEQPALLIHSQDAAVPDGARRFQSALPGRSDLQWTSGAQFDFYDQEPNVTEATDAAEAHLRRTLGIEHGH